MEYPVVHRSDRGSRCASRRQFSGQARRIFLAGSLRWPTCLWSLHLVEDHNRFLSVGASLFRGRRQNLGDELDHGIHTSMNDYTYSPILELRMYALHPGRRDELIKLFEREFIESQEAVGMQVIGQFHDLDDPDQFVWLRGFNDMSVRAQSLPAFY